MMVAANKFRNLVGRLIYLTHTHLEIAFVVGMVSRFMHSPTQHLFCDAKKILRYIAGSQDDRRNTTGYCFNLGSGAILWLSEITKLNSLIIHRGGICCRNNCVSRRVWLRRLLNDMNQKQPDATCKLIEITIFVLRFEIISDHV